MRLLQFCAHTILLFSTFGLAKAQNDLTPDTIGGFLDNYWEDTAEAVNIPGLAVAIISDDLSVIRTYGVEDLDTDLPVDSDTTGFRVASVSKVFVGIAAAQLVEQGRLDLDEDINAYLTAFQIDDEIQSPITMRQLLTHTARLDDRFIGDSTRHPDNRQTQGEHLKNRMPPRVEEPNGLIAYSNYGFALAGFVIEEISGMPFHEYTKEFIFDPLGMDHSGYMLEDLNGASLATGYTLDEGIPVEQPYTYVHRYPPTSLMVTPSDMTRFMTAMLNRGCLEENCIFGSDGAELIYQTQYTHHEAMAGMTLGFMDYERRTRSPGLWHDGSHAGFEAQLMILPEEKAAFFIATNSNDTGLGTNLRLAINREFFSPEDDQFGQPPEVNIGDINRFAGQYQITRRVEKSAEKIGLLYSEPVVIGAGSDGHLRFGGQTFYPIGPGLFHSTQSSLLIAFRENDLGEVTHFFADWGGSPRSFDRANPLDSLAFTAGWVGASILLSLLGMLGLMFGAKTRGTTGAYLGMLNFALGIGFIMSFTLYMTHLDSLALRLGEVAGLKLILIMPLGVVAVGALLVIWNLKFSSKIGRLTISPIISLFGSLILILGLNHWNLIGWNF